MGTLAEERRTRLVQGFPPRDGILSGDLRFFAADMWAEVSEHVPDSDLFVRDPNAGFFHSLPRDDATASCVPHADGSSLILIHDGLLKLVGRLAEVPERLLGELANSSRLADRRTGRLTESCLDGTSRRLTIVEATVRYWLNSKSVLSEDTWVAQRGRRSEVSDVIATYGYWFVEAHEFAHHVLGHETRPPATIGHDRMAFAGLSRANESEADSFAYLTVRRAAAADGLEDPDFYALLAAFTGLSAIFVCETGLFIRSSYEHPPAADRLEALTKRFGIPEGLDLLIQAMSVPINRAVEKGRVMSEYDWRVALRSRHVKPRASWAEVTLAERLDHLLRAPLSHIRLADSSGRQISDLVGSHRRRLPSPSESILREIGCDETDIALLENRSAPITFATLREILLTSTFGMGGTSDSERNLFATIAARHIAPLLESNTS